MTPVELSPVTVFPSASWIVAVMTRVPPEVRLAVELVTRSGSAAPGTTVKLARVPVVRPTGRGLMVTVPTSRR